MPFSTVRLLVPICAILRTDLFILLGMVRIPIDTRLGNGQEHSHDDLASAPGEGGEGSRPGTHYDEGDEASKNLRNLQKMDHQWY